MATRPTKSSFALVNPIPPEVPKMPWTVASFTTCMSGTKFTTSIGSNAEQNSVRKTRQAEEEQQQQQQPEQEQEQEQNKGEENVRDEVPFQLWS